MSNTTVDKKKRFRFRVIATIIGISVITLAVLAYQYYVEHAEWLEQIPLFPTTMQEITQLDVQHGDSAANFTFDGTAWSSPEGADIADALRQLTAIHILVRPGELSEYGLDEAAVTTITATDSSGQTAVVLLGANHGNNTYAKLPNADTIYLVSRSLADTLS